jgi:hypothetical protein
LVIVTVYQHASDHQTIVRHGPLKIKIHGLHVHL